MDSFSILVDLSSFFTDFRSKSLVYVNTGSMKTVASVVNHIKKLFGIEFETYVLSQNNYVPGGEDSRILKHLLSIRLAAESLSKERRKATENATTVEEIATTVEENGYSDKVSKKKRKLEEIPAIDTDETLNTGRSSKKKHKKKQGDNQDVNGNCSSTSPSIPVGHSATPESVNGAGTVKKAKDQHLAINGDSNSIQKKNKSQMPNKAFYGYQCEEPSQAIESQGEDTESIVGSVGTELSVTKTITDGCETPSDKDGLDMSANTDNASHKPKRKRIRKRKRANKEDIPDKLAETSVPKIVNPFASNPVKLAETTVPKKVNPFSVNSKLPKTNSKHIFFPEEVERPLQPSEEISANETANAEGPATEDESTLTDCPVNNKGPEEIHSGPANGDLLSVPVSAQQDHDENSGTDDPPSAGIPFGNCISKPKSNSGGRCREGLGKLLSLIRNDSPPVFERKKIPKNMQAVIPNKEDSSRSSTPTSKRSCSPVRFPIESEEASTIGALPDSVPAIGSEVVLTPLKTLPELNMKIFFQILKMSESYCPELSKPIVAIVKDLDKGTQDLSLKILSGEEECHNPTGKFSLEEEAEKTHIEEIILNFADLIEPKVFP